MGPAAEYPATVCSRVDYNEEDVVSLLEERGYIHVRDNKLHWMAVWAG
jgi:hypothetical protein